MREQTLRQVEKVEPRVVLLAAGGLLLLVLLAAWMYVFKPVLGEYRSVAAERLRIETETQPGQVPVSSTELAALEQRIETLERRQQAERERPGANEMVTGIIGALDRIAVRHGVTLIGVKPASASNVLGFEEQPFEVEASGSYFALVGWLADAQSELRPIQLKQFRLRVGEREAAVSASLQVVAYRAVEDAQ